MKRAEGGPPSEPPQGSRTGGAPVHGDRVPGVLLRHGQGDDIHEAFLGLERS